MNRYITPKWIETKSKALLPKSEIKRPSQRLSIFIRDIDIFLALRPFCISLRELSAYGIYPMQKGDIS